MRPDGPHEHCSSEEKNVDSFSTMPTELMCQISNYLTVREGQTFALSSKRHQKVHRSKEHLGALLSELNSFCKRNIWDLKLLEDRLIKYTVHPLALKFEQFEDLFLKSITSQKTLARFLSFMTHENKMELMPLLSTLFILYVRFVDHKESSCLAKITCPKLRGEFESYLEKNNHLYSLWKASYSTIQISPSLSRQAQIYVIKNHYQSTFFATLTDEQKNDEILALAAVKNDISMFEHVPDELIQNPDFVRTLLVNAPTLRKDRRLNELSSIKRLMSDRDTVFQMAVLDPSIFYDQEIEPFRGDRDFALRLIPQNTRRNMNGGLQKFVKHLGNNLKKDRDFNLDAVKKNGLFWKFIQKEFKQERTFILAAVQENGLVLKYADNDAQNDKEIVLTAVANKREFSVYSPFRYASDALKNNQEIALEAIEIDANVFKELPSELKESETFILKALLKNISVFRYIHYVHAYRQLCVSLIRTRPDVATRIPTSLIERQRLCFKALQGHPELFKRLPQDIKTGLFITKAIYQDPKVIDYLPKTKQRNLTFLSTLLIPNYNPEILTHIPNKLLTNKEFMKKAVLHDPSGRAYELAHDSLKEDGTLR